MKNFLWFIILVFFFLSSSGNALALSFSFSDIPSDDNPGLDLSANFSGDLTVAGDNQLMFTLSNNGPDTSTIASIYFEYDPDSLLSNGQFSEENSSSGVQFSLLDNLNLSQGNNISFEADFAQNADSPAPFNGININETAAFIFDGDYDAVVSAMILGDLRIGMHVINIGELSDSYVSNPPQVPVPEPSTALLMGLGLLGLSFLGRRKKA